MRNDQTDASEGRREAPNVNSINYTPTAKNLDASSEQKPDAGEYYQNLYQQKQYAGLYQNPGLPVRAPGHVNSGALAAMGLSDKDLVPPAGDVPWWMQNPDSPLAKRVIADIQAGRRDETGKVLPDFLTEQEREWLETGGHTYRGANWDQYNDTDLRVRRFLKDNDPRFESYDSRSAWLAENAPGAFEALVTAGLKPDDVATVHSVYMARNAADMALAFYSDFSPEGARQVLNAIPNEQRLMAIAFMQDALDLVQEQENPEFTMSPVSADDTGSYNITSVDDNVSPFAANPYEESKSLAEYGWDALNGVINLALMPLEGVTHTARMFALNNTGIASNVLPWVDDRSFEESVTPYMGEAPDLSNPAGSLAALKDATMPGFISAKSMESIISKYGKKNADIMYGYYQATQSEDEEAVQKFMASIENDPEARALITSAMRGENVGGDANNGAELFVEIMQADQGNWGNLVAGGIGLDAGTLGFSGVRDVANVASWFMFDPLLAMGKAGKAVKFARLGLESTMAKEGGSVAWAIANSKSQTRLYDEFGASIQRIANEKDPIKKAQLEATHKRQFTSRESRFLTDEHTEIALEYNLYDSVSWIEFYRAMDDVEKIVKGQATTSHVGVVAKEQTRGRYAGKARGRGKKKGSVKTTVETETTVQAPPVPDQMVYDAQRATAAFIEGQAGRRTLYMPHMTIAKKAMVRAGQNFSFSVTSMRSGTTQMLERAMGPEWASKSRDEQVDALTRMFAGEAKFGDDALPDSLGAILSDFKGMDAGGQRTVVGALVDLVAGKPGAAERVRKSGWARKRFYNGGAGVDDSLARTMDSFRRLLTTLPDLSEGIVTRTAKDAEKVYQLAVASGVGTLAARVIRSYWVEATEGQRQVALPGLVRTFLRASGVHTVNSKAEKQIMELMSGVRPGEAYAASAIPNYGGRVGQIARRAAEARNSSIAALGENPYKKQLEDAQAAVDNWVPGGEGVTKAELVAERNRVKALYREEEKTRRAQVPDEDKMVREALAVERLPGGLLDVRNRPDILESSGLPGGLWPGQMEQRMFVPNFQSIDKYAARQSYLNTLLFQGDVGSLVTDMWVLGTLYGPRFQLRNGLEDIGLYAMTDGKFGAWKRGRSIDQAVLGATARGDVKYSALLNNKRNAARDLEELSARRKKGLITEEALEGGRKRLVEASKQLDEYAVLSGRAQKKGIVRTALSRLSEKATYRNGETYRDTLAARIAQFLVPTTSRAERLAAAQAGREAVVELQARAILRQKLRWSPNKADRELGRELAKGKPLSEVPQHYRDLISFEERLLRSQYAYHFKDEAAETANHTMDGTLPTADAAGMYEMINGDIYKTVYLDRNYVTISGLTDSGLTERAARSHVAHLQMMTERYGLTQEIMYHLEDFWKAWNGVNGPNTFEMDRVVRLVVEKAQQSKDWAYLAETMRFQNLDGAVSTVNRMMQDAASAMTTRKGEWNQKLWSALRHEDDKGRPYFSMWDDASGRYSVLLDDFVTGVFDHPEAILGIQDEGIKVAVTRRGRAVSSNTNVLEKSREFISAAAWEPMGRSLARFTRNPIWYGNYVETSRQLMPLQERWAKIFGHDMAEKMATNLAAERAYHLTMAYVDNPSIRTNLAWQVRNVARYYRAQEDFARRMMRVTKFEPEGIWKATLAFHAVGDFGFVHEDQYGDKYFIYPFSAPLMTALGPLGLDIKGGQNPMAFGGKLQWLSPSLDPNSWAPSLSSPWAAVTLQPLLRMMPVAKDFFKEVERAAFGDISADSQIETPFGTVGDTFSNGLYNTMPPAFKKVLTLATLWHGEPDPGTYGYRMTMKTLSAYAAAGRLPTAEEWADDDVRREFVQKLEADTIGVTALSLIFGFFAPSSPQYMENAESLAAREAGYESLHPAFRDMIQSSVANGDTWNEAWLKWIESNPADYVWLPGITKTNETGYALPTMKNLEYVKQNLDIAEGNMRGMVPFLPETRDNAVATPEAIRAMKLYQPTLWKSVEERAGQMVGAEGFWQYMNMVFEADAAIEATPQKVLDPETGKEVTNPEWTKLNDARSEARKLILLDYPGTDYRVQWDPKAATEYKGPAQDIVDAAVLLADRGNEKAKASMKFVEFYGEMREAKEASIRMQQDSLPSSDLNAIWANGVQMFLRDTNGVLTEDQQKSIIYAFSGALDMEAGL